jgi:hypothetical protein
MTRVAGGVETGRERAGNVRDTIIVRIAAVVAGASLNYFYLMIIGRINTDNLIFLIFFSGCFMIIVNELIGHLAPWGIGIRRFNLFFTEEKLPSTTITGIQTVLVPLFFCLAIAAFQLAQNSA